jgi:16S rRNA G966 N2-methylase RsmD
VHTDISTSSRAQRMGSDVEGNNRPMIDLATNVLYYGDNLDILRRYLPDAAVDLVYLDPPFNSNRDDNVIFRDESGKTSDARLLAFEDTWQRAILGPARVLVHDDGHRGGMGAESDSVEGDLC